MAYKIVHRTLGQQVLFANRGAARRYADQYGGVGRWRVAEAGTSVEIPGQRPAAEDGTRAGRR